MIECSVRKRKAQYEGSIPYSIRNPKKKEHEDAGARNPMHAAARGGKAPSFGVRGDPCASTTEHKASRDISFYALYL